MPQQTLISSRFDRLSSRRFIHEGPPSTGIVDPLVDRIIVDSNVVQIHGEREQRLNRHHTVVGLPDDAGLAPEQPVELI